MRVTKNESITRTIRRTLKLAFVLALTAAAVEAARGRLGTTRHYPKVEDFTPPDGFQPVKGYETLVSNTNNNNKVASSPSSASSSSNGGSTAYVSLPSSKHSSVAPSTSYTSPQWYNYYQNNQALVMIEMKQILKAYQ